MHKYIIINHIIYQIYDRTCMKLCFRNIKEKSLVNQTCEIDIMLMKRWINNRVPRMSPSLKRLFSAQWFRVLPGESGTFHACADPPTRIILGLEAAWLIVVSKRKTRVRTGTMIPIFLSSSLVGTKLWLVLFLEFLELVSRLVWFTQRWR